MQILDAIAHLKQVMADESALGDLHKPAQPPGQLLLPGLVIYTTEGAFGAGSLDEDRWGLETIVAELHVARDDLARAYERLMGYFPAFTRAVFVAAATGFGGSVVSIGDGVLGGDQRPITYVVEPDTWNTVATLCLTYRIVVTTQEGTRV